MSLPGEGACGTKLLDVQDEVGKVVALVTPPPQTQHICAEVKSSSSKAAQRSCSLPLYALHGSPSASTALPTMSRQVESTVSGHWSQKVLPDVAV